jgi:lipoprotein-anchoring transpeptidase ErfK/SrfK
MTPPCSVNRILLIMRAALIAVFALAALAAAPALAAPPPTIAAGVTIEGLPVGGMTASEARAVVHELASRPFTLRFRTKEWEATAWQVGTRSHVALSVSDALAAPAGADLPLRVSVDRDQLRHYVAKLDRRLSRAARDSRVHLRHLRPRLTKAKLGYDIVQRRTRKAIRREIKANERGPVAAVFRSVKPRVTRSNFAPVIVIRRDSHRLYLYKGSRMRFRARFRVAVGQPIYPTPLGTFTIVTMQRNPWWYPPDSDWAAGASPIPPGPGNPLGTRWMGLSASGVGIHGTPDAASIGYSASHGCIRMRIPDAEWLFERVEVGSTVFIVGA